MCITVFLALASFLPSLCGQGAVAPSGRSVAHFVDGQSTRWNVLSTKTNESTGAVVTQQSTYVELADGLNYRDETGAWQRTEPVFRETEDGFAVLTGPHKVWLASNLNEVGAVSYLCEGVLLRCAPLSLGYYDPLTGASVLLARLKDTAAVKAADNTIVYPDCFAELHGSIRYRYELGAFHQDVVLHEAPLPPAAFGLSEFTRIEVITEFAPDMPAPEEVRRIVAREADPVLRQQMVEPDFTDATLRFAGQVRIDVGEAFAIGVEDEAADAPKATVQVGKRLTRFGGTPYLIEGVSYRALGPLLERLRASSGAAAPDAVAQGMHASTTFRTIPVRTSASPTSMAVAGRPVSETGVVIDYVIKSGSAANVTFLGCSTYYVSSSFGVSGTATFQSGAVIKYANNAYMYCYGPMVFPTTGVPPVVFTSKDDDLFGEKIDGSTGSPTHHASPAIWVYYVNFNTGITNAYFRWAKTGVKYDQNSGVSATHVIANSKFKNTQTGVYGGYNCPVVSIGSFSTRCNVTTSKACYYPQYYGCCISGDLDYNCSGDNDFDELTDSWEITFWGGTGQQTALGDPDLDGMVNYLEMLGGLDPTDPDTDNDGIPDLYDYEPGNPASSNVLATWDDLGNPRKSQFESSIAVSSGNVIVAYVDSKQGCKGLGYYQLGDSAILPDRVPRFLGYSVSQSGGISFESKGAPPLSTHGTETADDDGDLGDPVLAVDPHPDFHAVYLAGTSPRNNGHHGMPVWKSTDGGLSFGNPGAHLSFFSLAFSYSYS